ncbi:MAG: hypothetical protein WC728_18270 [Elusimicrobiota bacterium]
MQENEREAVDAVLLIDGDNDPHLPPDFALTERTLVRVFLRPAAKTPRTLERRLAALPHCVTVLSPKGGSNAADFVMSLHAGLLHATLPMHLPFTLVTADKSLVAMAQELQRIGRQAVVWSSHPEKAVRQRRQEPRPQPRPQAKRPVRQAREPAPSLPRSVSQAADAYARRLASIKDPPTRLKSLLNDIAHRAAASGVSAEAVVAELKRRKVLSVDESGRVVKG